MRLALCDDHRLFAQTLATRLAQAGQEVVGVADEPSQMAAVVRTGRPDGLLCDLGFRGFDPIAALAEVVDAAAISSAAVVVLTASSDADLLDRALRAGIAGIAHKSEGLTEILQVVTASVGQHGKGRPVVSPGVLLRATSALAGPDPLAAHPFARFLTTRQREVLARLVRGQRTSVMAQQMGISVSTVRTHIDAVLTTLGVHSRVEAVALAVREGLIRAPT